MRSAWCLLFVAFLAPAPDKYQYQQQGAISDWMYYRIGGGAAISPPPTRRNTFPLTAGVSWNSDMMCGNFDIDTTVRNQLNGVTDGFQQLMGEIIESATSTSSVSSNDCQGELCQVWSKPDDAAQWLTRVVGEQTINVDPDNDQSGDTDQQSGAQSGVGLTPLIQEEQDEIQPLIIDMVNHSQPVNDDTLAQASGGELHLTRGVIEALRDDPDAAVLIQRLSGELALSRVMEQALMARRTLLAGMREPNISGEKEAQTALTQTTAQLDQELSQLKLELDMRQALADNAALTILERQTMRAKTKGQAVGVEDDTDKRMDDLSKSTGGETQ
ncbi:TPA: hypothetical protein ACIPE5_001565 [Salmonella enterica subsp. diarizonae serovar 61:r:-]